MAEENTENKPQEKKKSKIRLKTLLIIIPILLFQIIFAFFLINKVVKPKIVHSKENSSNKSKDDNGIGEIYLIEDVIVNPSDTKGRRFVNVSLGLDCKDGQIISDLKKNDIKVRDYVISLISSCTVEELDDMQDKDILRKRIQNDINNLLPKKGIKAVYFTNFILQ